MSKTSLEEWEELWNQGYAKMVPDMFEYIRVLEERVKELEENLENGAKVAVKTAEKLHYAREENQRYKQALEFYADEVNYKDMGIPAPEGIKVINITEDGGVIARQSLQGGNENE